MFRDLVREAFVERLRRQAEPSGPDRSDVEQLDQDGRRVVVGADVRERIAALGLEPVGSTLAEFRLFVQSEMKKYAEIVRAAGIQPE